MSEALRRRMASVTAVTAPMTAPCHTNCSSAQPTACAAGCRSSVSIAGIVGIVSMANLLLVPGAVDQGADVFQFFGGRALRRERLHHELSRGPAEGSIEEIADQLPLRRLFAEPRAVDVRTVPLVAL